MARLKRQYLAWLLTLAYGSVSLVGYGWHDLLPHSCESAGDHATCHCLHDHESAEPGVAPPSSCHDPNQCQVCIFLAQAKSSSTVAIVLNWVPVSTPHHLPSRDATVPQPIHEPYAPRGPPALVA